MIFKYLSLLQWCPLLSDSLNILLFRFPLLTCIEIYLFGLTTFYGIVPT